MVIPRGKSIIPAINLRSSFYQYNYAHQPQFKQTKESGKLQRYPASYISPLNEKMAFLFIFNGPNTTFFVFYPLYEPFLSSQFPIKYPLGCSNSSFFFLTAIIVNS